MINVQEILRAIKPYVLGWIRDYWVYLDTPLTSTSWDGDSFSTTSATLIDLSADFGVPAGVKAVLVRLECNDSVALGTSGNYVSVGPSATFYYMVTNRVVGGDVKNTIQEVCKCNSDGDIYYRVVASGTNTMDVRLEIVGYLP